MSEGLIRCVGGPMDGVRVAVGERPVCRERGRLVRYASAVFCTGEPVWVAQDDDAAALGMGYVGADAFVERLERLIEGVTEADDA